MIARALQSFHGFYTYFMDTHKTDKLEKKDVHFFFFFRIVVKINKPNFVSMYYYNFIY